MTAKPVILANGARDCEFLQDLYPAPTAVRIALKDAEKYRSKLDSELTLWIDPGVDALERGQELYHNWDDYLGTFDNGQKFMSEATDPGSSITLDDVRRFTYSVLDSCREHSPDWISIPQVPQKGPKKKTRAKLNRDFAKAAQEWKDSHSFSGKLILPVIFSDKDTFNSRTSYRASKIDEVRQVVERCEVDGLWVVNAKLDDENVSEDGKNARFPGLLDFHEELREEFESTFITAGPYWAMNLILWARGVIDKPAISVATGFQYYVSGGYLNQPSERLFIKTLARRVKKIEGMKDWLSDASATLQETVDSQREIPRMSERFEEGLQELEKLEENYEIYTGKRAHKQVASAYRDWVEEIAAIDAEIRDLVLRQSFSSAEMLGRLLDSLPEGNDPQVPQDLAKFYMSNC
jgi:hypothetical protein